MQYAQKIALEDREYKRVQRPAIPAAKGALSLDIKRILKDKEDDHEKVKKYINALHRYINVRDTLPESSNIQINPITSPKKSDDHKKKTKTRSRRHAARQKWVPY